MILPLWFLVTALFLPRIALFCGWLHGWNFFVPQPAVGLLWFFLPRIIVLLLIVTVMGICLWFWLHVGAAAIAWILGYLRAKER